MAKQINVDNPAIEFAGRSLTSFFNNTDPFEFTVESATEVHFVASNEFTMVLTGTGFDDDGTSLTAGKITSATMFNADGDELTTISGFSIKADVFFDKMSEINTTSVFIQMVFKGKDTLTASDLGDQLLSGKGNDVLKGGDETDTFFAGKGDDRMTTGGSADIISFKKGDGEDVVTDFDVSGEDHDVVEVSFSMFQDVDIRKSGKHDTLLDFGGGDSILLLGVKPGQVEPNDSFIFS